MMGNDEYFIDFFMCCKKHRPYMDYNGFCFETKNVCGITKEDCGPEDCPRKGEWEC